MTPEDHVLCLLVRQRLEAHDLSALRDLCHAQSVCWQTICRRALHHRVAPLVDHNLRRAEAVRSLVPFPVLATLALCTETNRRFKQQRRQRIIDVVGWFNQRRVDVMLIKGAALDITIYDDASYMMDGDVDLVLRPPWASIERRAQEEIFEFTQHHRDFEIDPFQHHDITMNGALRIRFDRVWAHARRVRYGTADVYLMSPEDMLMSSCINACRRRFLSLKHLSNIREIIENTPISWDPLLVDAHREGWERILYAALMQTRRTLGCSVPGWVLDRCRVGRCRAAVLRYLVARADVGAVPREAKVCGRSVGRSLFLPYACYRLSQLRITLTHVCRQMLSNVRTRRGTSVPQ